MALASVKSKTFQRVVYPLRKQLVWQECEKIMQSRIVLFGQANNIPTQKMAELRHRLRCQNMFLRFPKPGVLRAYLRQSKWPSLECAVVGPTFCAVSSSEPKDLQPAMETLQAEKNLLLLGGLIMNAEFTIEGCKEFINSLPMLKEQQLRLVQLMQAASLGLVQGLQLAPHTLSVLLETHKQVNLRSSE